jgi:hypothetical protein
MSQPISRELMERFQAAAKTYRDAHERVERALENEQSPNLPTWVYNLETFEHATLQEISPRIASLERQRRFARSALHAVSELIALDDPDAPLTGMPAELGQGGANETIEQLSAKATKDLRWLRVLDRFIGVVGRADSGGAHYVNGGFQPLATHDFEDEEITQVREVPRR